MTWQNRTRETCRLVSPTGQIYNALWENNERNFAKKLGIFEMPNFRGTIVQDLDVQSVRYPLTVFFDGENHDEDAEDFFNSLYEQVGQWEVTHPTKGVLALQLVSCSEVIAPVENGNYTEFQTEWIQPANVDIILSQEDLSLSLLDSIFALTDALFSAMQKIRTALFVDFLRVVTTFRKLKGLVSTFLANLAQISAITSELFSNSDSVLDVALTTYGIEDPDIEPILEAYTDLTKSCIEISDDFTQRFFVYQNLIESIFESIPAEIKEGDFNTVLSTEFSLITNLSVLCEIILKSEYKSRVDVVSAMQLLTDTFNDTMKRIDEYQKSFNSFSIDNQYFPMLETYTELQNLFTTTIRFLLNAFFNLSAEKRFKIKNDRSPLEIAITEYGTIGENMSNYTLFLESNKLQGNDILLLPAGREVIIYV